MDGLFVGTEDNHTHTVNASALQKRRRGQRRQTKNNNCYGQDHSETWLLGLKRRTEGKCREDQCKRSNGHGMRDVAGEFKGFFLHVQRSVLEFRPEYIHICGVTSRKGTGAG